MKKNVILLVFCFIFIFLFNSFLFAQNGIVKGTVYDAATQNPMPGANVFLKGTKIGAATDIWGNYVITAIPPGMYSLTVKYIGYEEKTVEIMVRIGQTIVQDVELDFGVLKGENVVITAQASGQMAAINQQITSRTIKNVVSKDKIQELPEANAAEALARLPGISMERDGGEGQRITIRGIGAQHNKVQVNGVSMAATGDYDRGTNLSMISPYMLEGIEVTKAAMANNEADVIGGTVNFMLKNAPQESTLNVLVQPGYNSLDNELKDYKFIVGGSKRFFNNYFGVFGQVDIERRNRSSHSIYAGYSMLGSREDEIKTTSIGLNDSRNIINRYGATVVLDYKDETTDLVFSNFFSQIDRDRVIYNENYEISFESYHGTGITYSDNKTFVMTNSLKLEKYIGNVKLYGNAYYSMSEGKTPEEVSVGGGGKDPFDPTINIPQSFHPNRFADFTLPPDELIKKEWLSEEPFSRGTDYSRERNMGGKLNAELGFNLGDNLSIKLKTGVQYRKKKKEYDHNEFIATIWQNNTLRVVSDYLQNHLPKSKLEEYGVATGDITQFPWGLFIDENYDPGNFLNGRYEIGQMPLLSLVEGIVDSFKTQPQETSQFRDMSASDRNDYHGVEDYWGVFILPEIEWGPFTVIPGLRYEHNKTAYFGVRGRANTDTWKPHRHLADTTFTRENEYFLPMIHMIYRPNQFVDIRAAYTKTLSRPSYGEIIPRYDLTSTNRFSWTNPDLDPAKATNIDLQLSVHSDKIGLISIGGFHKKIEGFIYDRGLVLVGGARKDSLRLYSQFSSLPPWNQIKNKAGFYPAMNNPNPAEVYGYELEWQSNFWFMPGALSGLVLTVNYTRAFSETEYLYAEESDSTYRIGVIPITKTVTKDTSYTERLIGQPDHILNIIVGFDYKGFSIRGSMRYTSDIYVGQNYEEVLRVYSDPFTRFDLSVKQDLPVEGLKAYVNVSNLTGNVEKASNHLTGYPTSESWYGTTADFGFQYNF